MNVWRLTTHHDDKDAAVAWSVSQGRIAMGWGFIGDLRGYASSEEIVEAVRTRYPLLPTWGVSGKQLWNWAYEMATGDLVILSTGKKRPAVLKIDGDYEYRDDIQPPGSEDYFNQRRADEIAVDPNALWNAAGAGPAEGWNPRWTLMKCARAVDPASIAR